VQRLLQLYGGQVWGLINNIFAVLALQILHGFIFIVLAYSMATYINNEMPPELKASGQTVNSVIGLAYFQDNWKYRRRCDKWFNRNQAGILFKFGYCSCFNCHFWRNIFGKKTKNYRTIVFIRFLYLFGKASLSFGFKLWYYILMHGLIFGSK